MSNKPAPTPAVPAPLPVSPAMPSAVANLNLKRQPKPGARGSVPGAGRHRFAPGAAPQRVAAGTGVPGTTADLPGFLRGPDPEVRECRRAAETARRALAQLITTLQTQLPAAAAAVAAVEASAEIAKSEGFDVVKARELVTQLTSVLKALQ